MPNEPLPGFFEITQWGGQPPPPAGPAFPADTGPSADRFIFTPLTPINPWVINHNLGRMVHVVIYDDNLDNIEAAVTLNNDNQATVNFGSPQTGRALVI